MSNSNKKWIVDNQGYIQRVSMNGFNYAPKIICHMMIYMCDSKEEKQENAIKNMPKGKLYVRNTVCTVFS